ncbi:unnamed protein product [Peronospora belbahrii]|uniref:Serine hydrolase domain-containing protein n=1 Tax=Peronospora belbahrii TaxID=622444 RepID=A0ABN8CU12_9STRA|nr:unnamed protein product [Peronospora belbahrii]
MPKYRVLCLHGYRQNALKLHGRIAALRRTFKSSVEFVCLDAPFTIDYKPTLEEHATTSESFFFFFFFLLIESTSSDENMKQFKWFDYIQDEEDSGKYQLQRVEESINQGGTMASLILQRQVKGLDLSFAFRFAFFISAGACDDPKYASDVRVDLPSLHVIGETDAVVENDKSLALKDLFIEAKVLMHAGGHYIPTNKEPKDMFRAFFKELDEDGLRK